MYSKNLKPACLDSNPLYNKWNVLGKENIKSIQKNSNLSDDLYEKVYVDKNTKLNKIELYKSNNNSSSSSSSTSNTTEDNDKEKYNYKIFAKQFNPKNEMKYYNEYNDETNTKAYYEINLNDEYHITNIVTLGALPEYTTISIRSDVNYYLDDEEEYGQFEKDDILKKKLQNNKQKKKDNMKHEELEKMEENIHELEKNKSNYFNNLLSNTKCQNYNRKLGQEMSGKRKHIINRKKIAHRHTYENYQSCKIIKNNKNISWISSYMIKYYNNQTKKWIDYPHILQGNHDIDTKSSHILNLNIKKLRIYPLKCQNIPSFRLLLYTNNLKNNNKIYLNNQINKLNNIMNLNKIDQDLDNKNKKNKKNDKKYNEDNIEDQDKINTNNDKDGIIEDDSDDSEYNNAYNNDYNNENEDLWESESDNEFFTNIINSSSSSSSSSSTPSTTYIDELNKINLFKLKFNQFLYLIIKYEDISNINNSIFILYLLYKLLKLLKDKNYKNILKLLIKYSKFFMKLNDNNKNNSKLISYKLVFPSLMGGIFKSKSYYKDFYGQESRTKLNNKRNKYFNREISERHDPL